MFDGESARRAAVEGRGVASDTQAGTHLSECDKPEQEGMELRAGRRPSVEKDGTHLSLG